MQNFLSKKDLYIGKSLGFLLNDYKFKIVTYLYFRSFRPNTISTGIALQLFTFEKISNMSQGTNPYTLTITWKDPLPKNDNDELAMKSHLKWTAEVQDYYAKQIVDNIDMVRPNKN